MATKSRAAYYKLNPESYAKKLAYDKKRNASKKQKAYRADLARERRARGVMGKGGADMSHQSGGGFKPESPSKNRARNGSGNKARKASGKGTRKQK